MRKFIVYSILLTDFQYAADFLDSSTAYLNTVAEYDKLVILITSKRAVESLSLVFKLLDQSGINLNF